MTTPSKQVHKAAARSRFHASILGSIRQLAHGGSDGACWSTQNGKMQEILGMHIQGCDSQSAIAILGQAVLKSARVIEYSSNFPFAIGVQISCVPNQEVTSTGMSYAFTALPETKNSVPMTIYENDATTAESMAWRAQYPEYNASNLETQGVLNVQGESFVFVSKNHPVIDLLRANKDVLNADIDSQPLIDDQWVRAPARARPRPPAPAPAHAHSASARPRPAPPRARALRLRALTTRPRSSRSPSRCSARAATRSRPRSSTRSAPATSATSPCRSRASTASGVR